MNNEVSLVKDEVEAYNKLGYLHYVQSDFEKALDAYEKAISLEPENAQMWYNKANVLRILRRFEDAKHSYLRSIALDCSCAEFHGNLGILLQEHGYFGEAENAYKSAIATNKDYIDAYCNYAVLLKELRRFDESEQMHRQALAINPTDFDSVWNLALLKLYLGEFEEGWLLYESRHSAYKKDKIVQKPNLLMPMWRGEDLNGKTILVLPEQGYGDEIQFVRFVSWLKERGATVVLQCRRELKELFGSLSSVDLLIIDGSDAGDTVCDYWVFLMSLPRLLGAGVNDFARNTPYLSASAQKSAKWAQKLKCDGLKVGLVYQGNVTHANNHNRSIHDMDALRILLDVEGILFFSLQKECDADFEAALGVTSLGVDIENFADTAAIIDNLDMVICVDTAVAHLAGAMGKECWVLLPYVGLDWRWALYEDSTPWYPNTRLFRQGANESWGDVLHRVVEHLRNEK